MKMKNLLAPYEWALRELGISEVAGVENNPRIVWYHSFTKLKATDDETPWCSAFVCAAAKSTGFPSTDSAAASSWMSYGGMGSGRKGEIVVLHRDGGAHVGFVNKDFKMTDSEIFVLGGNQGNKVCIKAFNPDHILAFRRFQ
jgi:uncharacterized protein (TIGR02594 family)